MNLLFGRQIVIWMIIAAHLLMIVGCSTTTRVTLPGDETPIDQTLKLSSVILKDGTNIEFEGAGGIFIQKTQAGRPDTLIVGTSHRKHVEIDPSTVLEARYERTEASGGGSFLVGFLLGLPAGAAILWLVILSALGH